MMDTRMRASLDNYITGHYGEDQFRNEEDLAADVREERQKKCDEYRTITLRDTSNLIVKLPCYVSVMLEDLAYGGPEEGGWYYNVSYRVESHFCQNNLVLKKVLARVMNVYSNEGRREISSVLSEGRYAIRLGYQPEPVREPNGRPHYE